MRSDEGAARRRQRRPAPPRRVLAGLAACVLLSASGCASGAGPQRPSTPTSPTSAANSSAVTPPGRPTSTISYADNGRTVRAAVGQTVHLVLENTYWTVDGSSDGGVIAPLGTASHSPQRDGCVPGGGCGTVRQDFLARAQGQAQLTAHRTTCGEAMACAPAQRSFSVTVVVA